MKVKLYITIVQLDNGKFHQVWLSKEQEQQLKWFMVYLMESTLQLNEEPLDGMTLTKLKQNAKQQNKV